MISYQTKVTSRNVQQVSYDNFLNILKSEHVKTLCDQIQKVEAEMKTADETTRKQLHDKKQKLKRDLPCFIFQANFEFGVRRQSDVILTGLYMVDIDGIDKPLTRYTDAVNRYNEKQPETFCDSLKIALVAVTPSGRGLRIVAVADPKRGNLADNQKWLADQLGFEIDESCKDASRVSYAFPATNIIYINSKHFEYEKDCEFDKKYRNEYRAGHSGSTAIRKGASGKNSTLPLHTSKSLGKSSNLSPVRSTGSDSDVDGGRISGLTASSTLSFRGIKYADIIAEWWKQNGGEPVEGERNAKLLRLCSRLRYICDNNAAKLKEIVPSYGLDDAEVGSICEHACGYQIWPSFPADLRNVLAALKPEVVEEESSENEKALLRESIERDFDNQLKNIKLPPFFKSVMAGVPDNLQVGAVMASLPMLYTLATRVKFEHFDGAMSRLSGMTFVIGPPASGKSFIKTLNEILMAPIYEADKAGREAERKYKENKEVNKNKQKQDERPHPVIRITPIQISNSCLARRMNDAKDSVNPNLHLHIYHCETELATAIRAARGGAWIEKTDIYCKAFHNENWGMDYANDEAVNGEVQVNLNIVCSGTPGSFYKLIPNNAILSGLPTRLMLFSMPEARYQMIGKRVNLYSANDEKIMSNVAYKLVDFRGNVNAKPVTDAMYKWCEGQAKRAQMENDEELDDLRKRTCLIGERAAVVFAIIEQLDKAQTGEEVVVSKNAVNFGLFVANYTLYQQYYTFAARMRDQKQVELGSVQNATFKNKTVDLFNECPDKITIDTLIGKGKSNSAAKMTLSRWAKQGFVKRIGSEKSGVYEKIIKQI